MDVCITCSCPFPSRGKARKCLSCLRAYNKEWYQKNKEKRRAQLVGYDEKRMAKTRSWIMEYLSTHSCVDCGETDPIVLEFDHIRGEKEGNISKAQLEWGLERIQKEVAKCQVLCANCHRRKTSQDRNHYKEWFN